MPAYNAGEMDGEKKKIPYSIEQGIWDVG